MSQSITIQTTVNAPVAKVWDYWTKPEHITHWAFASDDWEAHRAENDLRVGGTFVTVMAAKDKSTSFDFNGTYTAVEPMQVIEYDMQKAESEAVARHVKTVFAATPEGTHITETFDMESQNSEEKQRSGWQAILDNFKKYVEAN